MQQQDYRFYRLSRKESLLYGITGFIVGSLGLYFFYQTVIVWIPGIACGIFYCKWKEKRLCENRKEQLEQQFKDWMETTSSNLQAGYSVENAFLRAGEELKLLYGKETDIQKEICNLKHLLINNVPLEKILWDFGERSGGKDIQNFADVFAAGKRSGGDLREMIGSCCEIIVMRRDTEREIRTLIHGKMTEQKIMCCVPFGIIGYISISSPGYFAPLYHNTGGICIMTLCLILYLFAVRMSLSIVRIEV